MIQITRKTLTVLPLLLIACSFFSFSEKDPVPDKKLLTGIWEMQLNNRPTGFLKIFGASGEISNVQLTPLGFVKTLEGSYEIQSDSTYIEKVEQHQNTSLNKKEVIIGYHLDNPNMLTITYNINNFQGKEVYRRVPFTLTVN